MMKLRDLLWYNLKKVYTTSIHLALASNWDCKDFETWVDNNIRKYNEKLIRSVDEKRVIKLINNGCD